MRGRSGWRRRAAWRWRRPRSWPRLQQNPASPDELVGEPDLQTPDAPPTTSDAPHVKDEQQIGFAADNLNYDSDSEVVIAEGNVQMNREAIEMRADKVTWNRKTGQVFAEGNVTIKNPEGDTAYGDKIELTDTLRDGVVENLLVVLDNGSRLAAVKGTRFDNGNIELENAAYTPAPSKMTPAVRKIRAGRIRAVRVMYDRAKNKIRYKGARVEIFGLPLIPLPGSAIRRTARRGAASWCPRSGSIAATGSKSPYPIICASRPTATSRSRRTSTPAQHRCWKASSAR